MDRDIIFGFEFTGKNSIEDITLAIENNKKKLTELKKKKKEIDQTTAEGLELARKETAEQLRLEQAVSHLIEAKKRKELQIKANNKSVEGYKAKVKLLEKEHSELTKGTDKATSKFAELVKAKAVLKKETEKLRQAQKEEELQLRASANTLDGKRARVTLLTKKYDNLDKSTSDYQDTAKRLQGEINRLNNSIRESEEGTDRFHSSVGNYKNKVIEAMEETGLFASQTRMLGQLQNISSKFQSNLSSSTGGTARAMMGGAKASRVLAAAMYTIPIFLIIGALAALISLFKRSQKGMDFLSTAGNVASAVFNQLIIGVENLVTWFGSLDLSFSSIGESIKNNIINRVKGATVIWKAFQAFLDGDWDKAAKLAVDGSVQMATGITNVTDKVQKAAESIGDLVDEVEKQVKESNELSKAMFILESIHNKAIISISKLEKAFSRQNIIADDSTRSLNEQAEAAAKATEIEKKLSSEKLRLAKEEEKVATLKFMQSARLRGDQKEYNEVIARRINAEQELNEIELRNLQRKNQIKQDLAEQELDFLLDSSDNQKTINEKIISNEEFTLERRRALLTETESLMRESYSNQIKEFEKMSDTQINGNEILKLNNKELLEYARNLGLSETMATRLLEVVRDRRSALQDLVEVNQELTKDEENSPFILKAERIKQSAILEKNAAIESIKTQEELSKRLQEIEYEKKARLRDVELEHLNLELENEDLSLEKKAEIRTSIAEKESEKLLEIKNKEFEVKKKIDGQEMRLIKNKSKDMDDFSNNMAALGVKSKGLAISNFAVQKSSATAENLVNTQAAISKAAKALPFPANVPGIAIETAAGLARQTAILSTGLKLERGGALEEFPSKEGGFIKGNSHAKNGVKFMLGNKIHEAEGGEIILNKNVSKNPMARSIASQLNHSFGGVKFEKGGMLGVNSLLSSNENYSLLKEINQSINQMKIVQSVNDLEDFQAENTLATKNLIA